uniref:Serpentine receptor class gamma n=1 Tax=Acrobeloides nanus TaxID=290746 RepID=A0A914DVE3_9BILA
MKIFHNEVLRDQWYIEFITQYSAIAFFFVCNAFYFVAFLYLLKLKFKTSQSTVVSTDILLFAQTFFIIAYKTLSASLWTFYKAPNVFMQTMVMFITVFEPSYHPYMYLIFNK